MKITTGQLRQIIREEIHKVESNQQNESSHKLNENPALAGQEVADFITHVYQLCVQSGIHPIYAVIVSLISTAGAIATVIASVFGIVNLPALIDRVKQMYSDFKARKKITPQQIKAVGDEFLGKVNKIKDPEKRKYFVGLLNKMKKTDPTKKQDIVRIQQNIADYADWYANDKSKK